MASVSVRKRKHREVGKIYIIKQFRLIRIGDIS